MGVRIICGLKMQIETIYEENWDAYSKTWHRLHGPKRTIASKTLVVYNTNGAVIEKKDIKCKREKTQIRNAVSKNVAIADLPLHITSESQISREIAQELLRKE